mmetsp:Transcript_109581/g.353687  ORF Transcript_109581/g.353687 Transcript_109581/m.353687 type:complete len:316 (-) Transcript_109581:1616-2563(-)
MPVAPRGVAAFSVNTWTARSGLLRPCPDAGQGCCAECRHLRVCAPASLREPGDLLQQPAPLRAGPRGPGPGDRPRCLGQGGTVLLTESLLGATRGLGDAGRCTLASCRSRGRWQSPSAQRPRHTAEAVQRSTGALQQLPRCPGKDAGDACARAVEAGEVLESVPHRDAEVFHIAQLQANLGMCSPGLQAQLQRAALAPQHRAQLPTTFLQQPPLPCEATAPHQRPEGAERAAGERRGDPAAPAAAGAKLGRAAGELDEAGACLASRKCNTKPPRHHPQRRRHPLAGAGREERLQGALEPRRRLAFRALHQEHREA